MKLSPNRMNLVEGVGRAFKKWELPFWKCISWPALAPLGWSPGFLACLASLRASVTLSSTSLACQLAQSEGGQSYTKACREEGFIISNLASYEIAPLKLYSSVSVSKRFLCPDAAVGLPHDFIVSWIRKRPLPKWSIMRLIIFLLLQGSRESWSLVTCMTMVIGHYSRVYLCVTLQSRPR